MDKFLIQSTSSNGNTFVRKSIPVEVNNNLQRLELALNEDENDSDSSEAKSFKRRKRNVFVQKFKKSWSNKNNGKLLTGDPVTGKTTCKVCNKVIVGGITHINRHGESANHMKKMKALSRTTGLVDFVLNVTESTKLRQGIKEAELRMVIFLAEHNLPMSILYHLPRFIASVCYDSQIGKHLQCGRKKGTKICKQITEPENLKNISEKLKNNWYSIIIDETTDVSTTKCLTVLARCFADDEVKDNYLGLVEVANGTAQGLFSAIKNLLNQNGIPFDKMIGFTADNAAVMQSNKNGVQAKFKEEIPDIFVLGCVCHSIALCSSAACKKIPTSIEELARDIVMYFAHSSKRQDEFKQYQQFIDISQHKLLKLSNTRWLSMQAVVNRILEQWQALILFFTNEVYDKLNSNLINPKLILDALHNNVFKLYFSFLAYILDIVNNMNLEFQSESPKLHLLNDRLTSLFRAILRNFIKQEHIDNVLTSGLYHPSMYKCLSDIYCGVNCEIIVNVENVAINQKELDTFKLKCLDFYVELATQIQSKFNFNDPVLKFMRNIDPCVTASGECESLVLLASRFPRLVNNIEHLNSEWRQLADLTEIKQIATKPLVEFWSVIFNLKTGLDHYMFPNVSNFVKGLLCLPHSSAAAERIFSQMALIKTKNRNKLHISTGDALLHTKCLLSKTKCYDFKPSEALMCSNLTTDRDEGTSNDCSDTEIIF